MFMYCKGSSILDKPQLESRSNTATNLKAVDHVLRSEAV
jgi:hypothetical protein